MCDLVHNVETISHLSKACFTLIVRPFDRAIVSWVTERGGREADRRQFHTKSLTLGSHTLFVRLSLVMERLPQDSHAKCTRLSQDKTKRRTCPALQPCVSRHSCGSLAIKRTVTLG